MLRRSGRWDEGVAGSRRGGGGGGRVLLVVWASGGAAAAGGARGTKWYEVEEQSAVKTAVLSRSRSRGTAEARGTDLSRRRRRTARCGLSRHARAARRRRTHRVARTRLSAHRHVDQRPDGSADVRTRTPSTQSSCDAGAHSDVPTYVLGGARPLPQREAHSPAISCPGARLAHTAGGIFRDVLVKPVRRSTRRCRFGTAGRPRMTPCSAPHEAANERLLVLGMVYAAEAHGRTRPGAGRSRRAHHVSVQSATFEFEPHWPPRYAREAKSGLLITCAGTANTLRAGQGP